MTLVCVFHCSKMKSNWFANIVFLLFFCCFSPRLHEVHNEFTNIWKGETKTMFGSWNVSSHLASSCQFEEHARCGMWRNTKRAKLSVSRNRLGTPPSLQPSSQMPCPPTALVRRNPLMRHLEGSHAHCLMTAYLNQQPCVQWLLPPTERLFLFSVSADTHSSSCQLGNVLALKADVLFDIKVNSPALGS